MLTTLHVAHLRVDLQGQQTAIVSGSCEPGDYIGPPVTTIPSSPAVGAGIAGTGKICGAKGRVGGFPAADIAQTDDLSGGQTFTQVPSIVRTTPINGETLYGSFIALAQTGRPGPNGSTSFTNSPVALTITRSGRRVFHAANVHTARAQRSGGLPRVRTLQTGYSSDPNGDTRTIRTGFVEAP